MIKAHGRVNKNHMRRAVRVYLNDLNDGKAASLREFLLKYRSVTQYFLERFWSASDDSADLADKAITDKAVKKYSITARLAQCAAKQAKELVRSQHKNAIKTMPKLGSKTASLDSRFVEIEEFNGINFDLCIKLSSGAPKLTVPLNRHKHFLKYENAGWLLGKSLRLGMDRSKRLWVDFFFEKERPAKKLTGKVIGVDRGYRRAVAMSDKQATNLPLPEVLADDKRVKRATFRKWLLTELNRELNKLKLSGIKTLILEDLKGIKRTTRGTFSRKVNKALSFWLPARAALFFEQKCEELGITLIYKSPWKTSQRCSKCGKIDSGNRVGDKFKCVKCGLEINPDYNASLNLELLGKAGVYSLRRLQT